MDFPNSPPPADSTDTVAPRPVIAHGEAAPGAKAVEERRERLAKLEAALAAAPWWRRERRNGSILLRWLLFVAGVAAPSLCLLWTAGEEYVLGMGLGLAERRAGNVQRDSAGRADDDAVLSVSCSPRWWPAR